MFPIVDLTEGRIMNDCLFRIKQQPETEDTEIQEIIMVYGDYDSLSYSHDDVALAVSYCTDFGTHCILFSKVPNLKYDVPLNWNQIFSSNSDRKNSTFVSSEVLLKIFHNLLHDIRAKEARDKQQLEE